MERIEERSLPAELRAGGPLKIGGTAVPYSRLSEDLGGFREQFAPGAFRGTLDDRTRDVVLLWAHDRTKPLASRLSGSLELRDAGDGLHFDASMNKSSWSADAHAAISAGTVRTVSFGFAVLEGGESWRRDAAGVVRTVTRAELREISPTVMAAYQDTSVSVRSVAEVLSGARFDADIVSRDLQLELLQIERE